MCSEFLVHKFLSWKCLLIWFSLLCLLATLAEGQDDDQPPKPVICEQVICKPPPEDQDCRPHSVRSEKIDAKLGQYKDCCPVFFCHGIGDGILYIGNVIILKF